MLDRRVLLLSLLWGFLLPKGMLTAQVGGPCLAPSPHDLAFPGPQGPSARIYLSGEGRVCRAFRVDDTSDAPSRGLETRQIAPGLAFLTSAALPGLGQRLLGQERWTAYVAAEVWAWVQYLEKHREGRRLQRQYRDLAWLVARRVGSGPRVDGSFEYYEALSEYPSSGAFDADPLRPGIQPESDSRTYNGVIWGLAREIFLPDQPPEEPDPESPSYGKALEYYASRAYAPNFTWNWGPNILQQGEYRNLIEASDENLRRSTTMVGLILANHLLSAVDGLISGRLGASPSSRPHLEAFLLLTPFSTDAVGVRIRIPLPGSP